MSKLIYKKRKREKRFFSIKKTHIVDNLKTNFFMNMNIIKSKKIIINIFEKHIHFKTTNVLIFYKIRTKNAIKIYRIIKIIKKNDFF